MKERKIHFQEQGSKKTVCGIKRTPPEDKLYKLSYDVYIEFVNCKRCQATKTYKKALKEHKLKMIVEDIINTKLSKATGLPPCMF